MNTQRTATGVESILAELRAMSSERNRASMARYGINVQNAFGVSIYELRKVAKRLGTDHDLALALSALWSKGNHEARLLACFVDDPAEVTREQMETWAGDFDSWDICDQATTSLFDLTTHAWAKAREWAARDEEWVKRGGDTRVRAARWVAADALRGLGSEKMQARLGREKSAAAKQRSKRS